MIAHMAGASLLTLIDDIASILDDVAVLTKGAAKKTTGVLGDDLALNAEQVSGVNADRELPVVWAVAKGSLLNKLILVPAALLISQIIPWLISPLLILGGLFLCYEGFEKVFHELFHRKDDHKERANPGEAIPLPDHGNPNASIIGIGESYENEKIKGAIRTDFILSAEIIVITLGTVAQASLAKQTTVLSVISLAMTFAVYGLVAGIVKIDDFGLFLTKAKGPFKLRPLLNFIGKSLLGAAPLLMRGLGVLGTTAMFLVGGGILTHEIPIIHHLMENLSTEAPVEIVLDGLLGIVAGGAVLFAFPIAQASLARLRSRT